MNELPPHQKVGKTPQILHIDAVLQDREQTHGNFAVNTRTMQALKEECRTAPNWLSLTAYQKEAVEMICHKLGRILCGNPDTPDHWLDIAGYSTLVYDQLTSKPSSQSIDSTHFFPQD